MPQPISCLFKRLKLAFQTLGWFSGKGSPTRSRGLRHPPFSLPRPGRGGQRVAGETVLALALPLAFSVTLGKQLSSLGPRVPHCKVDVVELGGF